MSHIALLALDLDGTLLRSDKALSPRTLAALDACRRKGIRLVVATGRARPAAAAYAAQIRPDALVVNGGAAAYVGNGLFLTRTMPAELSGRLAAACLAVPGIGTMTVETPASCFVNAGAPPLPPDYAHAKPYDFHVPLGLEAYELTAELPDEAAAGRLAAAFPQCSRVGFTGDRFVRFALKGADKRTAVEAVAACWGIDLSAAAAFGDDYNDIPLLCACGMGVAMGNAAYEVKAAANQVTATNDADGVALWLEKHLL